MKIRLWAALLVTLATIIGSTPVYAGEHWCEEDPVLTIDGRTVDYTVSFPLSYVPGTTVNWVFHIPSNVLVASAITPPAIGSPAVPSTVRIYRDLAPYVLLSQARVITTLTFTTSASFPTAASVWGPNTGWTTYTGISTRSLTFANSYSTLPLLQ